MTVGGAHAWTHLLGAASSSCQLFALFPWGRPTTRTLTALVSSHQALFEERAEFRVLIDQRRFRNVTEAHNEIMSFIGWYNHCRRHTALAMHSRVHYEQIHHAAHVA